MRTFTIMLSVAGLFILSGISCSKNKEDFLINQNLSEEKLAVLMDESMSIKQLEEYTGMVNTPCGQSVQHEGEISYVYAEAYAQNIVPDENRILLQEYDSIYNIRIYLDIIFVGNNDKIFARLAEVIDNDFYKVFHVIIKGKIFSADLGLNGACEKGLFLESDELYVP